MKRKIYSLLCGLIIVFNLTGCRKNTVAIDSNGIEHPTFGRFITLSDEKYYDLYGYWHQQFIAYDKDTKIMYIIENNQNKFSISPFYVMNNENEPVIGVYNGDLEDVE